MFESAELGHSLSRDIYDEHVGPLREALLDLQYELKTAASFPVLILVNGLDAAGKGETVNLLNEWMDPRLIASHAFSAPSDEEAERPTMWRYWRALPPKGRIGVFFGAWYEDPIFQHARGLITTAELDKSILRINRLERMLVDEGALIIKLWFHLSKKKQRKRLEALEADPLTQWRVGKADWKRHELYDNLVASAEHALRQTSMAQAPWHVIEGWDEAYRALTTGRLLEDCLKKRLQQPERHFQRINAAPLMDPIDKLRILDRLQLDQPLDKTDYRRELAQWQGRLNKLSRQPGFARHSVVVVFEGNDAAGKGGAVRRLTQALDARLYRVIPIAAPTEEERAQPYLWRFWRHLPRRGRLTLYDRSWYGRVLVERVEGFCSEADWMRAYSEINDFEQELVDAGTIVVKFWLAISADEQLQRFKEREATGYKRFKITEEDWRNRDKWDVYSAAVNDMVERTSTEAAPWTLVEANNKYFARIKILKTICKAIEARLEKDK